MKPRVIVLALVALLGQPALAAAADLSPATGIVDDGTGCGCIRPCRTGAGRR